MENVEKKLAEKRYSRNEVVEVINSVVSGIEKNTLTSSLYKELKALATFIESSRKEIQQIHPQTIGDKYIPDATDELDEVVKATEAATGKIMDSCDAIQMAVQGAEVEAKVTDSIMQIFEACSFQDITGQRITKVIRTLKEIESKVDKIVELAGASAQEGAPEKEDVNSPQSLLNGPQLPANAISQEEIDKLLASFD